MAFAAYRTTPLESNSEDHARLSFSGADGYTEINLKDAFNGTVFTCPQSGVYYIYVSGGANPERYLNYNLRLDGESLIDVVRLHQFHTGYDTLGRGILIHLFKGQVLFIEIAYSRLYADTNLQASFFGYLLYND